MHIEKQLTHKHTECNYTLTRGLLVAMEWSVKVLWSWLGSSYQCLVDVLWFLHLVVCPQQVQTHLLL